MTFLKRRWWLILIIFLVIGGGVGTFIYFKEESLDLYHRGQKYYESQNIEKALSIFEETLKYPEFLGSHIYKAEKKLAELNTYLEAKNLWNADEYYGAIEACKVFLEEYPLTIFKDNCTKAILQIPFDWAYDLLEAGDYAGAIAKYGEITENSAMPDERIKDAKSLQINTYFQWAEKETGDGDFSAAEEVYLEFLSFLHEKDITNVDKVMVLLTDLYIEWSALYIEEEDYASALTCLEKGEALKVDGYVLELRELQGETVWLWANSLLAKGELLKAGEKFVELIEKHESTHAYKKLSSDATEPLILYTHEILTMERYSLASKIARAALNLGSDDNELLALGHFYYAEAEAGKGEFVNAWMGYNTALELTEDPLLITQIETAKEDLLYAISWSEGPFVFDIGKAVAEYVILGKELTDVMEVIELGLSVIGTSTDEKRMLFFEIKGKTILSEQTLPKHLEATQLGHLYYFAVMEREEVAVQICNYAGHSFQPPRIRKDIVVTIYFAQTGKVFTTKTFYGSDPPKCPDLRALTMRIEGNPPRMSDLYTWLETVVE